MFNLKALISSLLFLLFLNFINAQPVNCNAMRNGIFKMTSNGKTAIIKRYKDYQLEYYDGATNPTVYTVKWIDNCTYTLKPDASAFLKYPDIPKNALLTIMITKLTKKGYTIRATANFNKNVIVGEVIKIK
jgi:hypothetical protein